MAAQAQERRTQRAHGGLNEYEITQMIWQMREVMRLCAVAMGESPRKQVMEKMQILEVMQAEVQDLLHQARVNSGSSVNVTLTAADFELLVLSFSLFLFKFHAVWICACVL